MNAVERFDYEMNLCNELGYTSAAKILGVHPTTISCRIREVYPYFKPRVQSNQKWFAEDIANIFELLSQGLKISEIATYIGITDGSLKYLLVTAKKNGFDAYPKRPAI